MPTTYNVSMGQAVSVRDLGEDALVTGITSINGGPSDPGRALSSCSAVALVNTRTRAAGLFHFPAGDILDVDRDDPEVIRSRQTLRAMVRDINPNQVHFGHGPGIDSAFDFTGMNNRLPTENAHLRRWVQAMVPNIQADADVQRATAGSFLIRLGGQDGNQFEADIRPEQRDLGRVVDLSEARAGEHRGFRMYGRTVSEQDAEHSRIRQRYEELRRSGASTPASRASTEPTRSGPSTPRAQSRATRSGAGTPAPREQFEVAEPIPNVPPRHRCRWLRKAIRRMTCRGG